jgi:hypothetical protein
MVGDPIHSLEAGFRTKVGSSRASKRDLRAATIRGVS